MTRRLTPEAAAEEFDRFVAGSADALLRAVYLVVFDRQEAEDLLQECYVRLARRWPRVRRMENPRAYARKVLVNLALDERRRQTRRRDQLGAGASVDPDGLGDDGASAPFGRVEWGTDLQRALAQLPARQRAALVLRYFEDLTEAQTAAVMGCTVGTVKSTTARALERLRTLAPQWGPAGGRGAPGGADPPETPRPDGSAPAGPSHDLAHRDPERSLPR